MQALTAEECESDSSFMEAMEQEEATEQLQRRRQASLEAVQRNAKEAWRSLPDAWKRCKEFVLAALEHSPTLPPKAEFERLFPQTLRFDKQVVLAWTSRSDFAQLYHDRHLYIPGVLTNDKQVVTAYCRKIPRSLQEASEALCGDEEVVMAAIELDGLELQYANRQLQNTKSIVMAACEKDGRALEFCPPGPLRDELTQNREFMLQVLRNKGGPMLRLVSGPLAKDQELLLEALRHGMRFRFCPQELQGNKQFLLQAISCKASVYLEVSHVVQQEEALAYAAVTAEDSTHTVQKRALEWVPSLPERRPVALALAKKADTEWLVHFFTSRVGSDYTNDLAVMLEAVQRDSKLYRFARPSLVHHPDLMLAAVDADTAHTVLRDAPLEILLEHVAIVCKAIRVSHARNMRQLKASMQDELWQCRPVVMEWIKRGFRVLEVFEGMLQNDRELGLLVAQFNWREFSKVGLALRADAAFIKQAVELDGRTLQFASAALKENVPLAMRAVANHPDALAQVRINKADLQAHCQAQLDLQQTFLREFLRGIAISTPHVPPAHRSHLPMLDRGVETSQAFKIKVAEFLGVPVQQELKMVRTALHNLQQGPSRSGEDGASLQEHPWEWNWERRRLLRRARLRARFPAVPQRGPNGNDPNAAAGGPPNGAAGAAAGLQHNDPAAAAAAMHFMIQFDGRGGGGGMMDMAQAQRPILPDPRLLLAAAVGAHHPMHDDDDDDDDAGRPPFPPIFLGAMDEDDDEAAVAAAEDDFMWL